MYFVQTPKWIQSLFPDVIWRVPNEENKIYLTFDDGPSICSEWILATLEEREIRATFFCLGENLEDQASVSQIHQKGHQIGNHSFSHENGWKTKSKDYFESVAYCQDLIDQMIPGNRRLFRPPFGKMKWSQYSALRDQYKIVMWSLMVGDFDDRIDPDLRVDELIQKTQSGDVIVFHDNKKSEANLKKMLPKYLDACQARGLEFGLIG